MDPVTSVVKGGQVVSRQRGAKRRRAVGKVIAAAAAAAAAALPLASRASCRGGRPCRSGGDVDRGTPAVGVQSRGDG
ncbi:hypothetical protein GCM10022262_23510 [Georgenia daeguensis]|uniref:Twin-arginine translocation signal domain-containing protein n=1 Tax=Georgenia daeguensis TaxID=908355 RepID=A0ABP8EVI4_9MICO